MASGGHALPPCSAIGGNLDKAETRASIVGSTRYAFTIDNPKNKEFVALWQKEHGT